MQKGLLWLLLFQLSNSAAFPQKKEIEWVMLCGECSQKRVKEVISHRWQPYAGIHVSGDAEMYYVGPSFQAGMDYFLKKRILVSAYIHYFSKKVNNVSTGGFFENGKFKTITGTILIQTNTAKKLNRSIFFAGGVAVQRWRDNFSSSYDNWDDKRTTFTPAIRLGYFFPIEKNKMSVELNGIGPYSYGDANSSVIEILTQISFGARYIF